MKKTARNLEETKKIAQSYLASVLRLSRKKKAHVVGLYGNLGAGKTAFTQALASALGIKEKVVSPTFVLMKKFLVSGHKFKKLVHLDAYRLEKKEELVRLGWADIVSDPENLVLIEWPERVAGIMPAGHDKIIIRHIDEKSREFIFN